MLTTLILLPLLTSAIHAAPQINPPTGLPSPEEMIASNTGLTHLVDPIDSVVVALTESTPAEIAQNLPPSLRTLTRAIASNINDPTINAADAPAAATLVHSYGLFANSVEELMFDFARQNATIKGIFGLQAPMNDLVGPFNGTFQEYAELVLSVVTDAKGKVKVGYNTANATLGINTAANAYAPLPVIPV